MKTLMLMLVVAVVLSSITFGTNTWFNPLLNNTVTAVDSAALVTSDGMKHNALITYTNESLQCSPGRLSTETDKLYYQWHVNNETVLSERSSSADEVLHLSFDEGEGGIVHDYENLDYY